MLQTLTIVVDTDSSALGIQAMTRLGRELDSEVRWLAPEEACAFTGHFETATAHNALAENIGDIQADWAILPARSGPQMLLVADMDSTIITVECIDELADFLGIKEEITAITRRAMDGELDFANALKERVAMLKGLRSSAIVEICRERLALTPGASTLVQTMKKFGARTALVSGGFTEFTEYVAGLTGFDEHFGNRLEIRSGQLTGKVVEPIRGSAFKLEILRKLATEMKITVDRALVVGDGANDEQMVRAAGVGCAFRAHPILREAANVSINLTTLETALFVQGIKRADFVTS